MTNNIALTLTSGHVVTEEDLKEFGETLYKSLTDTRELLKVANEQNRQMRRILDSHNIPYESIIYRKSGE